MIEQILMGASAVITISTAYVGWHLAKQLQRASSSVHAMRESNAALARKNQSLQSEVDRMSDVIGKHQSKAHKCDKCNQFASKRKAKTAELAAYVASKKAV